MRSSVVTLRALCLATLALSAAPLRGGQPTIIFSHNGSSQPRYSTWNGSAWSAAALMPSAVGEPYWLILRAGPLSGAMAAGSLDSSDRLNVELNGGSGFGSATQVCSDTATHADRPYDLAYEPLSGDLLVVYWDNTQNKVGYRTSTGGGALSAASYLTLPSTNDAHYVTLYARPGSDQIMLLALNTAYTLYAATWSGSSWSAVTTLETSTPTYTEECYGLAYEQVTKRALLVYGESGASTARYRTWNGSAWSSEASLPSTGFAPKWVRLAAKPGSNEIALGCFDADADINVNVWNGSAWGADVEVENNSGNSSRRQFDIAYQPDCSRAVIAYGERLVTQCRYRTWNGSAWSSEQSGPSLGNAPRVIAVVPGASGSEVFVVVSDTGSDLTVTRWNGTSMSSATQIESTLGGSSSSEQFMLAAPTSQQLRIIRWREVPNPDPLNP